LIEKTLLKGIVVDPKIMLGKPVTEGARLPVEILVEKVAYGTTYTAKRVANKEIYSA